jgi:hypothetical protein
LKHECFAAKGFFSLASTRAKLFGLLALVILFSVIFALLLRVFLLQQQARNTGQHTTQAAGHTSVVGHITPTASARVKTYYVSKNGSNSDGRSWLTAWNELNQINWSIIQPGDVIFLDGGSTNMVYTTTLTIGKSGTQVAPITIERTTEAGRNGKVVIFGGRSIPLPYCGQSTYTNQTAGVNQYGIEFGANSWVTVDGMSWGGIKVYGHFDAGVDFTSHASNDTVRNAEVYDNGHAYHLSDGTWQPNTRGDGVNLFGSNLTFEQMDLHDNGDDALEGGDIHNITIRHSWLHETREDPTQRGLPFNQCVHQDGIQIWGGGVQSGIVIEDSIFGPGLKEGTIIGQTPIPGGDGAIVNDVTIRNTVFLNKVINVMGYSNVKEKNWTLDHVTVFSPNNAIAIWLEGSGHVVTNSIFYEGQFVLPDGLATSSGNCQWHTNHNTGAIIGQTADPKFVIDVSTFDASTPLAQIANANYALQAGSPCAGKGSSITSVAQLINSSTVSQPSS